MIGSLRKEKRAVWIKTLIAVALLASAACTPTAVKTFTLSPSDTHVLTLADVAREYEGGVDADDYDMEYLSKVVVFAGDSIVAAFKLEETRDVIYLYTWLHNGSEQSLVLSPDIFTLVDGSKSQLRRLSPHEAANIFLADVEGIPPYEPKYNYRVNTYTYGNYSSSTVTKEADPGYALGYAIGAAIQRKHNERLTEMASAMYGLGLVYGTELAADANMDFGVYWLNEDGKSYPLELRVEGTELRIHFEGAK